MEQEPVTGADGWVPKDAKTWEDKGTSILFIRKFSPSFLSSKVSVDTPLDI
jgi:hypothetical protein